MIEKTSTKFWLLILVLIPYFILIGYTISIYSDLPGKVENDFPRVIVFLPAFAAAILPATYGIMVFFFSQYLRKAHLLTIAAFMDIGIIGLIGAVFWIKHSS